MLEHTSVLIFRGNFNFIKCLYIKIINFFGLHESNLSLVREKLIVGYPDFTFCDLTYKCIFVIGQVFKLFSTLCMFVYAHSLDVEMEDETILNEKIRKRTGS